MTLQALGDLEKPSISGFIEVVLPLTIQELSIPDISVFGRKLTIKVIFAEKAVDFCMAVEENDATGTMLSISFIGKILQRLTN